jgi:hypothetical protein
MGLCVFKLKNKILYKQFISIQNYRFQDELKNDFLPKYSWLKPLSEIDIV